MHGEMQSPCDNSHSNPTGCIPTTNLPAAYRLLTSENKKHKTLYDLINKQDYKSLSIKLADYSLDSDDESVSTIVNGLYMNGTAVSDLLDYVIDIAGHIVENKLATDEISHADAYLSRKILSPMMS